MLLPVLQKDFKLVLCDGIQYWPTQIVDCIERVNVGKFDLTNAFTLEGRIKFIFQLNGEIARSTVE